MKHKKTISRKKQKKEIIISSVQQIELFCICVLLAFTMKSCNLSSFNKRCLLYT